MAVGIALLGATTALLAGCGEATGHASAAPAPPARRQLTHQPAAIAATPAPARAAGVVATAPVSPCTTNTAAKAVIVSIGVQHAWMCEGATTALDTPVTTGADDPDHQTLTGSWTIQAKQADRELAGPGYSVHVDYWMPYDGDFGFHDASWQTFPFGSDDWRTAGSHGCVHLPTPAMAWLFNWAGAGTPITINA